MAYTTTEIKKPDVGAPPVAPTTQEYKTPDVQAQKPTMDTSKTGYQAPTSSFQQHNLNQGLLEYTPDASKNVTFDGREINASAVGADIKQTTPDFAEANNFLTDGAFVENRVAGLLENPDNVLNQRMTAQGKAIANASGMANSTMGATIGTSVLADKAIQIAGQDATTQATGDLNRQTATYESQGKIQDAENQAALNAQGAQINSAAEAQKAGLAWDSNEQKAAIQADLNKQGANIAGAQNTQNQQYAYDAREHTGLLEGAKTEQNAAIQGELAGMESMSAQNLSILQSKLESAANTTADQNKMLMQMYSEQQNNYRTTLNNEYSKVTAQAQLNADQRGKLANAMTEMANNYEISIQNILLDPNLNAEAKNSAIERINKIFDQDMNNISRVFGATYTDTTV